MTYRTGPLAPAFAPVFALALAMAGLFGAATAGAQDKVSFGTNWRAQAEHGGYYQAVATGIYKKYGLEVDLRQGGPQVNHAQLLIAGRIDFAMGSGCFQAFNYVENNIPMVVVGTVFQKDPQVIIAHPNQGAETLGGLKGRPILIAKDSITTFWPFLKAKYGFSDDQIKPYTFNAGPFLADKRAAQQGYLTSEPFSIEQEAKFKPVVHLLADQGYANYSQTVDTSMKLVREKPDLVQRFVNASIEGWISYLNGDPKPGNDLIKRDNPEQTDALIAYSIAKMKEYGLVDSGDAKTLGLFAMSDARWKSFYDFASGAGLYKKDLDFKKAYTLQFVNKKHGQ